MINGSNTEKTNYNVAVMYLEGVGVEKDLSKAAEYMLDSANAGYDMAQYRIGMFYKDGVGVTQNYDLALKWLMSAGKSNNPDAMFEISRFYKYGLGVDVNLNESKRWSDLANALLLKEQYPDGWLREKQLIEHSTPSNTQNSGLDNKTDNYISNKLGNTELKSIGPNVPNFLLVIVKVIVFILTFSIIISVEALVSEAVKRGTGTGLVGGFLIVLPILIAAQTSYLSKHYVYVLAKKWINSKPMRLCVFCFFIWVGFVATYVIYAKPYGYGMDEKEYLSMLQLITLPPFILAILYYIYVRFIK